MKVFTAKNKLQAYLSTKNIENHSVGFVPTMGALHQGHLSLIKEGLKINNLIVVSIFVNPTQFGNTEDLEKYPRTLDRDIELLKTVSKNIVVYAPLASDIYGDSIVSQSFNFDGLEYEMEGKFRAGHFDGVGTIVKKLFEAVKPSHAYFGEKDYQQLQIIKKLVEKYRLGVTIVGCKIHREPNGLAMSSRNERLSNQMKVDAGFIFEILNQAKTKFGTKSAEYVTNFVKQKFETHNSLELEYFIIANQANLKTVKRKTKQTKYRAFIAVYAENIRLIDNIALN